MLVHHYILLSGFIEPSINNIGFLKKEHTKLMSLNVVTYAFIIKEGGNDCDFNYGEQIFYITALERFRFLVHNNYYWERNLLVS